MRKAICCLLGAMLLLGLASGSCMADTDFVGKGTLDAPYILSTAEDLFRLAETVNAGESYEGKWFRQVNDIDLESREWISIGLYDGNSYFHGIYDGNGYAVMNLNVSVGGNNGFFGKLGGMVMNLGIDSGVVAGTCVGAISSHSSSGNAAIVNCYNYADVEGSRAGGIADNFNGSIIGCWSAGKQTCPEDGRKGGIVSYRANQIRNCFSVNELDGRGETNLINSEQIENNPETVVQRLNQSIFSSAAAAGIGFNYLNLWVLSEEGQPTLSSEKAQLTPVRWIDYVLANWVTIVPWLLLGLPFLWFSCGYAMQCRGGRKKG